MAETSSLGYVPVNKSGDTMTGELILNANPTNPLGAVPKQYADAIVAGFDFKTPCYAATTGALTATYLNGASGIGATLVNAGALAAFAVDGVSPPVSSRILVKDQASAFQNGIYTLTTVGSAGVAWVLTRATDYDQAPSEIFPGNFIIINNGTANAGSGWLQTATVATIGTDPISMTQFGGGDFAPVDATYIVQTPNASLPNEQALSALATGIVKNTTATGVLSIAVNGTDYYGPGTPTPVAVTAGGTGLNATTANQLLYSSANNTIAGLATANSGLLVTSGGGVPSIGTAIPNGVTATTQSASDNSTKVATTAYVDAAAATSGGLTLLASAVASNSVSLNFTTNINSTYDAYVIKMCGIVPATDGVTPWARVSTDGGSTWVTTSSYTYSVTGEGTGQTTSTSAAQMLMRAAAGTVGNAAGESMSGDLKFFNPSSSALYKQFMSHITFANTSGNCENCSVAAMNYKAATVINGVQTLFSSGNMTSGAQYLYGVKK